MRLLSLFGITFFLMVSCQSDGPMSMQDPLSPQQIEGLDNLFGFFDDHAYDPQRQAYWSDLDNAGQVMSEQIFTVATSRLVYGLAYAGQWDSLRLAKSEALAEFQLNHLIGLNEQGPYAYSFVHGDSPDSAASLDVWQQAYAMCGLTELYRQNQDPALIAQVRVMHDAFVGRFADSLNGGFWGNADLHQGPVSGSKSLQSLMYPLTAYLANLWLADETRREDYESILARNLELLAEGGWNEELGWVNVKFQDDWTPCASSDSANPCAMVTPGHNFQLAALLLRASEWPFIQEVQQTEYHGLGISILRRTLQHPIFDPQGIGQGFYSEVNPISGSVTDTRKTWWQHAEAIIALTLAGEAFQTEQQALLDFFWEHFPDRELGGEYFFLTKDNQPIRTEWKGSIGKSTYHTVEMVRFLHEQPK
ncbi:AGE family epimerase/isomerase [Pontibacter sp. G13]|uniref:AGE family epimerase/isomerase n=1 Tax=Pontibacter sp. G13 TaxID=3074898 RepID=UPI00288AC0FB|nr:AGE family epimerase/isomerase [Pontibacter sp. G13]WNJ17798.1 AGE family epimerase/isomerase [Pontibacter sp. G13]